MLGTVEEARELKRRCQADPGWFSQHVLGRRSWSAQRRLRASIRAHKKTLAYSANSVGKTNEAAADIIEWLLMNSRGRVIVTGPRFDTIRRGIWAEVMDQWARSRTPLGGDMQETYWKIGHRHDAVLTTADDPSSLQGMRGDQVFVVIDEAQALDDGDKWDALESLLTAPQSRLLVMGNPLVTSGRFFEFAHGDEFYVIQIDGMDHPNVVTGRNVYPGAITRGWAQDRLERWGAKDPRYVARVRGQFPDSGTNQIVARSWLDLGCANPVVNPLLKGRRMGVDLARYGDDQCVASLLVDGELEEQEEWGMAPATESASRIIALRQQWGIVAPHNVKVDSCGLGGPIADICIERGLDVDQVNNAESPAGDWPEITDGMVFKNRRDETHYIAGKLIERGEMRISKRFPETRADLCSPTYTIPNGVWRAEEKDAVKKRLGRSPDKGDSVVIAVSNAGNGGFGITSA